MSPPPRFLFDECLGKPAVMELIDRVPGNSEWAHLVDVLRQQGVRDDVWIPQLAAEGRWIIITTDGGRRASRGGKLPRLCKEHGITHVVMSAAIHRMKTADKMATILHVWPRLARLHDEPPGTRFKLRLVAIKGSVTPRIALQREK